MPDVVLTQARRQLRDLAIQRLGFASSAAQEHRAENAVEHVLSSDDAPAASELLAALSAQSFETPAWQRLIEALVVGETHFFRQAGWFAQLKEHVLKPLIETRLRSGIRRLRLWSAACSTGEEAYTLALIVRNLLDPNDRWDVRIIGTDINERFLADARRAEYRAWSLREIEPAMRARYFRDLGTGRFELAPGIRDMVAFRLHDLAEPAAPAEEMDLVVCRNVLMYLTPERQAAVARRLVAAVAPDGWLAVAPAEAAADGFLPLAPFNVPSAIFFHHPVAAPPPPQAAVPRTRRSTAPSTGGRAKPRAKAVAPDAIDRIRALVDRGELAAARGECETLLADDSLSYAGNVLLALICEELDDLTAALAAAKHAAYIEPRSAAAHFLCAAVLARLGRTTESQRKMQIVVQLVDAAALPPCRVWDVSAEQIRQAAVNALAGAKFANVRSSVGAGK
jgi:chemotaxis protein methyltransferase CheR